MPTLLFCTGNFEKFSNAKLACEKDGIELLQQSLEIDEIQSEDGDIIVRDKIKKAFADLQKPVVVTDDTWEIPGLNGFPGPYMKSINHWFTPDDLLRLTLPLEDRRAYLTQRLGFTDGKQTKVFTVKIEGQLLKEIRGSYGAASHKLIALDGDNGLSIAEIYDKGLDSSDRRGADIWHEFAEWYKNQA